MSTEQKVDGLAPADGGPAFPHAKRFVWDGHNMAHEKISDGGMTLRDYFAAKALQGLMANPNVVGHNANCGWSLVNCKPEDIANFCDVLADAMLRARSEVSHGA